MKIVALLRTFLTTKHWCDGSDDCQQR